MENVTVDVNEVAGKTAPAEEAIDLKAYENTKNDMHKFKRQALDTNVKLDEAIAKIATLEEDKLKSGENYKELWEKQKSASQEWEGKYKGLSKMLVEDKKMNAIKNEAVKAGLGSDWMDMLNAFDTSDVIVETTSSGNFMVNGADTWVEALKADKPMMFKQKADPNVNNKSGSFDNREKTYSPSEVLRLQREDPAKYQDVIQNKKHLIK